MKKYLALAGCSFLLKLSSIYAELQLLDKPLIAPSTKSVYQNMGEAGTKHATNQPQKSKEQTAAKDEELVNAHFSLGNLLFDQDKTDLALESYQAAAQLNQKSSVIQYNIGMCYKKKNDPHQAVEYFKQAIELNPDYARAYMQWGILENKLGKKDAALELLKKALAITPNDATILKELACIYRDQHELQVAIEALSKAHSIEPDNMSIIMELANTLSMANEYEKALALYQHALVLKPALNTALYNIGYILKQQGHIDAAIEVFDKVLDRDPHNSKAHFSLGLCYLMTGKLSAGWPEYEWRWQAFDEEKQKFGNKPYWDGSSLTGKTILVICEQGLGDTFQFIRYAKLLHNQGAHVIVRAQKALKTILRTCCPYLDTVIAPGDQLPAFDYQVHLMSLPFILKTEITTIPKDIPYIKADQKLALTWRTKTNPETFNIGICWQGNSQYRNTFLQTAVQAKSTTLKNFLPLTTTPGCTFYSLQKINGTEQLENLDANTPLISFGNELDEEHGRFMDTAAIIANLDLVITIDTSIAHLAAALAKPTWIILPHPADWRWMLDRTDTPWYPQVRLFRQKTTGDWNSVMAEVKTALEELLAQRTRNTIKPVQETKSTCPQTVIEPDSATTKEISKRVQSQFKEQPIDEFIDNLTIAAIKADTSIDLKELSSIASFQESMLELYQSYIKTMPQLKDLTACLFNCNKLLLGIEQRLKQITSILHAEFQDLVLQCQWITTFKNYIKQEIKKLASHHPITAKELS